MKQLTAQEKNAARFGNRSGRTIVVKGVKWKWRFLQGGIVTAYSEQGGRVNSYAEDIMWGPGTRKQLTKDQEDWDSECEFDDGPDCYYSVKPKDIESWLKGRNPLDIGETVEKGI